MPTGGWCADWAGDPDRGFNNKQPGGWLYNILPYMEMQALHDEGKNGDAIHGDQDKDKAGNFTGSGLGLRYTSGIGLVIQTAVNNYYCPSRRPPALYYAPGTCYYNISNAGCPEPQMDGQSDYAANAGCTDHQFYYDQNALNPVVSHCPSIQAVDASVPPEWIDKACIPTCSGVIFHRSMVYLRDITDGTSCTYLAGEKYMQPEKYTLTDASVPPDIGSDQSWDHGCDYDVSRFTSYFGISPANSPANYYPLLQDQPGVGNYFSFGSAHSNTLNMVFCDGSVQAMSYSIDPITNDYLGERNDHQSVDPKKATY